MKISFNYEKEINIELSEEEIKMIRQRATLRMDLFLDEEVKRISTEKEKEAMRLKKIELASKKLKEDMIKKKEDAIKRMNEEIDKMDIKKDDDPPKILSTYSHNYYKNIIKQQTIRCDACKQDYNKYAYRSHVLTNKHIRNELNKKKE